MSEHGPQEVVLFLDSEHEIVEEMFLADFERLLSGNERLDRYAASKVHAVYCVVGNGLSLRGAVFFLFSVDENGAPDANFNLPLQYLAQHAGVGADLGQGGVRIASRGKCPVPWHSVNLWEPGDADLIDTVQRRVFRNKLRLKTHCGFRDEEFFASTDTPITLTEAGELDADEPLVLNQQPAPEANGLEAKGPAANGPAANGNGAKAAEYSARLNEVFGAEGKLSLQDMIRLHSEQLNEAKAKYRQDVESQQLAYLDQLRAAREEIHALKVALRQEQGRNRRLQQMLRGDL